MREEYVEKLNEERLRGVGNLPVFPFNDNGGLTKREYIATQLLASLINTHGDIDLASKTAVKYADSLIKELNSK